MKPIDLFLSRFPDARHLRNGWHQARCPAHDDQKASFGFREQPDEHVMVKCQAGCTQGDILTAMGLVVRQLYPDAENGGNGHVKSKAAFTPYDYHSKSGKLVYQSVRQTFDVIDSKTGKPEKKFFCRRPDGTGGWIKNIDGVTRVLYHLQEVSAAAKIGGLVLITEGEKHADALRQWGFTATTSAGGCSSWRPEFADMLVGADVLILPDNDNPGKKYAAVASASLAGKAVRVRILELPGLPEHGDIIDWMDAGGTCEEFTTLIETAELVLTPEAATTAAIETYRCTPLGNAERLIARYGSRFRFCFSLDHFIVYDGARWVVDEEFAVEKMAEETIRAIPDELAGVTDSTARTAILGHAMKGERTAAINDMLNRTRPQAGVTVKATMFDVNPWLLNCFNGTLDLQTGNLRAHSPDDHLMKLSPVAYNPDAECPLWTEFLYTVMQGNHDLVTFLQRAAGYSLTAIPRERVMFILHGRGRNGKSCFLNTIRAVLGDYAVRTPTGTLLLSKNKGIPNDVARLTGTRFVTAAETSGDSTADSKLDEALIKDLTGCEPIAARFLHREFFEFLPRFKLWLGTNHIPSISGTDDAIWDRIRLVPFHQRFYVDGETPGPEELPADLNLQEKLYGETEGILAWAVRGCLDWQREGMTYPAEVRRAVQGYRADQDTLIGFIRASCKTGRREWDLGTKLYDAYSAWCGDEEKHPESTKTFASRLKSLGYERHRTGGITKYYGLSLLTTTNQADQADYADDLLIPLENDSRGGITKHVHNMPNLTGSKDDYEPGAEG